MPIPAATSHAQDPLQDLVSAYQGVHRCSIAKALDAIVPGRPDLWAHHIMTQRYPGVPSPAASPSLPPATAPTPVEPLAKTMDELQHRVHALTKARGVAAV